MRQWIRAGACAVSMALAAPAIAQGSPPASAPAKADAAVAAIDPDRLAAARELTDVLQVEKQYDVMLGQLMPMLTVQVFEGIKNNVQVPASVRTKLADPQTMAEARRLFAGEVEKQFKARYASLKEATAREYALVFTAGELRELIAFYRAPLGQKTLAMLPTIQRKLVPIGMAAGAEAGKAALIATIDRLALDKRPTSS